MMLLLFPSLLPASFYCSGKLASRLIKTAYIELKVTAMNDGYSTGDWNSGRTDLMTCSFLRCRSLLLTTVCYKDHE